MKDGAHRKILLPEIPRQRSEEHTSELQSQSNLVCRLLLEKKKTKALALTRRDRIAYWLTPRRSAVSPRTATSCRAAFAFADASSSAQPGHTLSSAAPRESA